MSIGTTDISLYNTIASQLNLTATPVGIFTVYGVAENVYGVSSGSYHNLGMGPSQTMDFATAIWLPKSLGASGQNLKMENWMYYDHNATVKINLVINDQAGGVDANFELYLSDSPGAFQNFFWNGTLSGGSNINEQLDTGVNAYSTFYGINDNGYFIDLVIDVVNQGSSRDVIMTATDTDGVGGAGSGGTDRETYTDANGNWDPGLVNFTDNAVGRKWNDPNEAISWNKRTTFMIDFMP